MRKLHPERCVCDGVMFVPEIIGTSAVSLPHVLPHMCGDVFSCAECSVAGDVLTCDKGEGTWCELLRAIYWVERLFDRTEKLSFFPMNYKSDFLNRI